MAAKLVRTRFLVISDTHGTFTPGNLPSDIDVLIHCGDITDGSKLEEFTRVLHSIKQVPASLKLIIAGNHDWTLDVPMFKKKVAQVTPPLEEELVKREYGSYGQVRQLFDGLTFLDEGTHAFDLKNGAALQVYASPYTESIDDWGFQYSPDDDHEWAIPDNTDVVITHNPPQGVFDWSDLGRMGSPSLFDAVSKARPRMHCFGHAHQGWGAKLAAWRPRYGTQWINHLKAFDNVNSTTTETIQKLVKGKFDDPDTVALKARRLLEHQTRGYIVSAHCAHDPAPLQPGLHTLFVNAALQGVRDEYPSHLPWVVDIDLPVFSSV